MKSVNTAHAKASRGTNSEFHQLQKLLDSSLDVICSFDHQGHFLYASAAAKRVWGYEPEELIGRKYMELIHSEDHPKTMIAAEAIMAGVNVTNFENHYIKKDGSLIPVVWSATWDNKENVMYCVAKDATEKKQLEENLGKSRQLFETFMSNSPLVGWITDENGVMQYMNDLFLKNYSFSKQDIGKSIYAIFPGQDAVDNHMNNLRILREAKTLEAIEKAILPGGKEQVLKVFKFPIQIDGVKMVAGWAVDITDQMELQRALERSVERYHYVNEATSDAIFEWDVETSYVHRGQGFTRIFGKVLSNKPFHEDLHPQDRSHVTAHIQGALAAQDIDRFQVEYRQKTSDGIYKHLVTKAFIVRQGVKAVRVIGAVQDITEQRKLQEELNTERINKEVIKSLVDVQEKERKSLSLELHDNVNQMLAACKLMLECVQETPEAAPGLIEKCHTTLKQAMVEIRKISHELNPSVLDDLGLVEAIENLIEKITITGKLNIKFENNIEDDFTFKQEYKVALYRILQEQLSNILKHAEATNVMIAVFYKEDTLSLSIEDDGKGFDTEKANLGLGLKNIRNRVEIYNGEYTITSQPNKGCKLTVQLKVTL